jgi:hypothetical protein
LGKKFAEDPQHAFPGHGQMKPEQLEIARLKREVAKLKSRDLLREGICFIAKHRGICPAGWLYEALGCVARLVLCPADTTVSAAGGTKNVKVRASFLASVRSPDACDATC